MQKLCICEQYKTEEGCAGEAQEAWQSRLPSVPEVVRESYRKAEEHSGTNGLRNHVHGDMHRKRTFAPPGRPPGAQMHASAKPGTLLAH